MQEQREAAYVDMDKATEEKDAGNTGRRAFPATLCCASHLLLVSGSHCCHPAEPTCQWSSLLRSVLHSMAACAMLHPQPFTSTTTLGSVPTLYPRFPWTCLCPLPLPLLLLLCCLPNSTAFKEGRYPEAVQHYQEALKRGPPSVNPEAHKVYSNLAACYTKLGAYPEGVKAADK